MNYFIATEMTICFLVVEKNPPCVNDSKGKTTRKRTIANFIPFHMSNSTEKKVFVSNQISDSRWLLLVLSVLGN